VGKNLKIYNLLVYRVSFSLYCSALTLLTVGKFSGYSENGRGIFYQTCRASFTVTIANHNDVVEFLNLVVHDFIVQLSAHRMPIPESDR